MTISIYGSAFTDGISVVSSGFLNWVRTGLPTCIDEGGGTHTLTSELILDGKALGLGEITAPSAPTDGHYLYAEENATTTQTELLTINEDSETTKLAPSLGLGALATAPPTPTAGIEVYSTSSDDLVTKDTAGMVRTVVPAGISGWTKEVVTFENEVTNNTTEYTAVFTATTDDQEIFVRAIVTAREASGSDVAVYERVRGMKVRSSTLATIGSQSSRTFENDGGWDVNILISSQDVQIEQVADFTNNTTFTGEVEIYYRSA